MTKIRPRLKKIVVDKGYAVDWGYPSPPNQPQSSDQPR
jgi:hypothetical protein